MKSGFWDFENGEMCKPISDNMAMSSNGDLLMRMSKEPLNKWSLPRRFPID